MPEEIVMKIKVTPRTPDLFAVLQKEGKYYAPRKLIELAQLGLAVQQGKMGGVSLPIRPMDVAPAQAAPAPAPATPPAVKAVKQEAPAALPETKDAKDAGEKPRYTIPDSATDAIGAMFDSGVFG